ncbi:NHLP bacteriocin export ABC transporter permease/ATPase subunit [Synechococcus sp. PCC 6312]|uniref:NHLP bacteriocin export ABC transporter permease/ATPase subunit n=1 Tax=Synechococcus sp. (strain ATCC 27167 / PCC 6312) TaxID=195253 RepID=UPI00029F1C7F|nr:NHLP bacteriocin export ABC transporter permease/ATPase subunit [Synechococcus sp. PCC 6312]AFY60867.1 NHLM bacteriocin system ABC transporter, ATP-binding protein [Synechococcus sp. PCC 6312]
MSQSLEITGKLTSTWFVQEGFAAIFSVQSQHSRQQPLFIMPQGSIIFGLPVCEELCVRARAIGSSRVTPINFAEADPSLGILPKPRQQWLEVLAQQMYVRPELVHPHPSGYAFAPQLPIELGPGEVFRLPLESCYWVMVLAGEVYFQGNVQIPAGSLFPLTMYSWVLAKTAATLTLEPFLEYPHQLTSPQMTGWHWFGEQYLAWLIAAVQAQTVQEFAKIATYETNHRQTLENAYGQFDNVLVKRTLGSSQANPLNVALHRLGKIAGLEFSGNLKLDTFNLSLSDQIQAIARASRIRVRRVQLVGQWWRQDSGVMLGVMAETGIPIVLTPQNNHSYTVFNSATQLTLPILDFKPSQLEPSAYVFTRPLARRLQGAWNLVRFALHRRWHLLGLVLLIALVMQVLLVIIPAQLYHILIDQAIPAANYTLLTQLGIGLFASVIAVAFFQFLQGMIILQVETWAEFDTQAAVWDRVLELPANFFRNYSTGGLTNRIFSVTEMRKLLTGSTLQAVITGLVSLGNLGMMFYLDSTLTWIAIGLMTVIVLVTFLHAWFILNIYEKMRQLTGNLYGMVVQLMTAAKTLQVTGAVPRAFLNWSSLYSQQQQLTLASQTWGDSLQLFNQGATLTSTAILFGVIGFTVESGELSTGNFVGFNTLYTNFFQNATHFAYALIGLLPVVSLWRQVEPILQTPLEVSPQSYDPGQLQGAVQVVQVCYRYQPDAPLTLNQINLEARPGEFIALVGPSGSGKSTLFRLLLGFDQPETGGIFYDGQELSQLDLPLVRRQIGLVLQHSRLLPGSIFENIACGETISRDQAWEVLEQANLAKEVSELPMQLETRISEGGGNFSGGQIQRLLIARALAHNPKILLFDEATSALDNQTQALITATLNQLQITRIIVAHRLSTIRQAQRIYVLEQGQILQVGTFEELVSQPGLFANLARRQLV